VKNSLKDDNPDYFRIFTYYAYTGYLHFHFQNPMAPHLRKYVCAPSNPNRMVKVPDHVLPGYKSLRTIEDILIDMYIWAEGKGAHRFQNILIDQLVACITSEAWYPAYRFKDIWDNTSELSPLRILFIDSCLFYNTFKELKEILAVSPLQYGGDIIYHFARLRASQCSNVSPADRNPCHYHLHPNQIPVMTRVRGESSFGLDGSY
jgi:hypothetical protein